MWQGGTEVTLAVPVAVGAAAAALAAGVLGARGPSHPPRCHSAAKGDALLYIVRGRGRVKFRRDETSRPPVGGCAVGVGCTSRGQPEPEPEPAPGGGGKPAEAPLAGYPAHVQRAVVCEAAVRELNGNIHRVGPIFGPMLRL